ncbi:MAG: hypothetical protein L6Q81_05030 [Bacteroidia bacterium]|nr:hypothetical protein [Bacteroidia bacterium]
MSLTSFLTESKELREKLRTSFTRPAFELKADIIAPPLTKNYSVVGQAFDYLLRFWLQNRNKKIVYNHKEWVADIAYERIIAKCARTKGKLIEMGRFGEYTVDKKKFLFALVFFHTQSKESHASFVRTGKVTNKLLQSCLFLARLDIVVRAGFIDQALFDFDDQDITDLKALYQAIADEHFVGKNRVILNPYFGHASTLVGGADSDIIIDNMLIDIKTTKNLTLERDHLNQLIGYYLLSRIGGILDNPKAKRIDTLALYYSRFGLLYKFPVTDLGTEEIILECEKWFYDHANQFMCNGKFEEYLKSLQPPRIKRSTSSPKTVKTRI